MMNFVFDVDDTLYDMMQPFVRAFNALWKDGREGIDLRALFVRSRFYGDRIFDQVVSGKLSVDESGEYRISKAMADFAHAISAEEARRFQQYYRRFQYDIRLSDTMRELLDFLKEEGCRMAILTNGVARHQQKKIDGMGLSKWFAKDHIFISEAIGASKPDPQAFAYLEDRLHIKKEDTWYIGDSIVHDVEGAKGALWHMIFLNRRDHDASKARFQPDKTVKKEEELKALIKELVRNDQSVL